MRWYQLDMTTIIDGYNLIFRLGWQGKAPALAGVGKGPPAADSRIGQSHPALLPGQNITIVFDAKKTPVKETESDVLVQGFRVIFAANHDEADALIEELISRHSAPKSLTVVSDDNRLQTAARRRKAIALNCEQWLEKLASQPENGPSAAAGEMSKDEAIRQLEKTDWLAEFGVKEETAEPDATPQEQPEITTHFPRLWRRLAGLRPKGSGQVVHHILLFRLRQETAFACSIGRRERQQQAKDSDPLSGASTP